VNKQLSSSLIRIIAVFMVVGAATWMVMNRQVVLDFVRLQAYTPTAEIKALADNNRLLPRGRDLLYISDPQVQSSVDFNNSCSTGEKTIVLGCYKSQRIYLYNVTDTRFNGVKEVTAAHEMLHAAYERLSDAERQHVDTMLKPIVENMKDVRILELIKLYNQTEPGQLNNEMHSILGTEYASLTPELESYYKQYFQDRGVIVAYANQYQEVFTQSKEKIAEYDQQLGAMKPQIDQNNATLKQMQSDIQSWADQLNQLRAQGDTQQYNQSVPGYNAKVAQFNVLIEQTKSLVDGYNQLVDARNAQVTAQVNLYDSLKSSNYQPAAQN
jgi:uncharacterized protein YaaR (DUF327 family)